MRRASRLHIGDMGKSFSLAFVIITVIWGLVSHYFLGRIFVSWQILAGNLAVSGTLSALYYRFRYHRVLEYDEHRFVLHTGTSVIDGNWGDFSLISLYHKGYGVFTVRLYRQHTGKEDFVELPATDIGLDASDLRRELTEYMRRGYASTL